MAPLTNDELPAAYRAADAASLLGQSRTRWLVGAELVSYTGAGASGVASWRVGHLDILAGVGVLSFTVALVLSLMRARQRPEAQWYEGRAGAESVKTLAWRFAVGGDPFPIRDPACRQRLLDRIEIVIKSLERLSLKPLAGPVEQVTPAMVALRSAPLEERREAYVTGRLSQQMEWYGDRARKHGAAADKWVRGTLATTALGLIGGMGRFLGWVNVDVLGLGAALAASATAWTQLLQHQTLSTSYAVAAHELALARDRAEEVSDEASWSTFVSDSEEAISREHTMWQAKRGHLPQL